MATKRHSIVDTSMWAKVFDSNKETKDYQGNPYDLGGLFKIDVVLDKENKLAYKASGTAGKGKFDDDGNFIATFKRKENERFEWAGGAPKVVNADGSPFEGTMIPNGSKVEIDFTVYTTSMTPGTRLEQVKVLSLADLPERTDTTPTKPVVEAPKVVTGSIEIPF